MALLLISPILTDYIDRKNLKYLREHDCDCELYTKIRDGLRRIKMSGCVPLEGSIKERTNNEPEKGRYTVPLAMYQWNRLLAMDQKDILQCIGFTMKDLERILDEDEDIENTDLIFGKTKTKGKIYLDFGSRIICYEIDHNLKVKNYNGTANRLLMKTKDETSVHNRNVKNTLYNGYPVFWTADTNQSKTFYTRPVSSLLLEIADLCDLIRYL